MTSRVQISSSADNRLCMKKVLGYTKYFHSSNYMENSRFVVPVLIKNSLNTYNLSAISGNRGWNSFRRFRFYYHDSCINCSTFKWNVNSILSQTNHTAEIDLCEAVIVLSFSLSSAILYMYNNLNNFNEVRHFLDSLTNFEFLP